MKKNYNTKSYRKIIKAFSISVFLIVAMLYLSFCSDKKTETVSEGYYTCSMHPQVIRNEPGSCPICGMDLTFVAKDKKSESEDKSGMDHTGHDHSSHKNGGDMDQDHQGLEKIDHSDHAEKKTEQGNHDEHRGHKEQSQGPVFSLSTDSISNANITTVSVKKQKFTYSATYTGHIDYNEDPNHLVIVNTKYDGWVEKLFISKEGQFVRRGQALLGIFSPKILAAKEEYLTTYRSVKNLYIGQGKDLAKIHSDPTLLATQKKLRYLDVPLAEIRQIEKKDEVSRLSYYYSPIGGAVIEKNVLQGKFIKSGEQIYKIANLYRLWVYIHIFEKDLPFVKRGHKVAIDTTAYGDKKFSAYIDQVFPFIRQKTRDIQVRVLIPNPGLRLKPGMYVNVELETQYPRMVLSVPDISIIYSGKNNYLFVSKGAKGDHRNFELRRVELISKSNGRALLQGGVHENELVVTNGQFLLDSEASLREAVGKSMHRH